MLTGQDTWHVRTVTRGRFHTVTWNILYSDVAAPEDDMWHVRIADVGQPDYDMWQTGMTTRGSIRERHVAGPYRGHMASPGRDMCHTDLAHLAGELTNVEVTRVTNHRVTRGTLTSSGDVAR